MSTKFECTLKIKGQSFDLEIEDSTHNSFGYIFPKIKEISKIAVNEEIFLSTHEFHIIDDIKGWKAEKMDQIIRNKSTIYISSVVPPVITPAIPPVMTPVIAPEVAPKVTHVFTSLVTPAVTSLASYPYDVDMRVVPKDDNQRQSHRPPISMRLPPKPTLEQTTPLLQQKSSQSTQSTERIPQKSSLTELLVKQTDKSIAKSVPLRDERLKRDENEIKLFHIIVMSINIGWDLRDKDNPNWDLVERRAKSQKSPLRVAIPSCNKIIDNFYYWSSYYAQNYDSIDGLLEPSYQQIFDLLKVVHILDLDQLFSRSHWIRIKIKEISETKKFKEYFKKDLIDIWRQKLETKIVVKNRRIEDNHYKHNYQNDFNNNTRSAGRSWLKRRYKTRERFTDRHYPKRY